MLERALKYFVCATGGASVGFAGRAFVETFKLIF